MKKPLVDLNAIKQVSAEPLRSAVALYRKITSEITAARAREVAIRKEIDAFMDTANPDDTEALRLISTKKIQADVLPNIVTKQQRALAEEIVPSLVREVGKFQNDILRFYREAHDAVATQLAETFRPFFARECIVSGDRVDLALNIARQTDDCLAISMRLQEAESIRFPEHNIRSNAPESYDSTLIQVAGRLLALAEKS